jgi:hypothetical protein
MGWELGWGGKLFFLPGVNELGDQLGALFCRTMADPGNGDQLRVQQALAELRSGMDGDGAVGVAPEDEARGIEAAAKSAAQTGHVAIPGLQQAQQVEDGSGGAQVVAIGLEALGRVPALGAGHAAETDHLQPLGQPGHEVSEDLAGFREIEANERIALAEVRMRGRQEHQRMDGVTVVRGEAHGYGPAMRVAEDDGLVQVQLAEKAADLPSGNGQAWIDVVAAFGLAGSGQIEREDVEVGVKLLHQGNEGFRATHESVEEDERGLSLGCSSPFEVGEAKAVHHNLAALHHGYGVHILDLDRRCSSGGTSLLAAWNSLLLGIGWGAEGRTLLRGKH